MRDKTRFSKKAEKEYGFGLNTHLIYLYHDKHKNRISISKSNTSEKLYIQVFTGPKKFTYGRAIITPDKTPFGGLTVYFEDYHDMLDQLNGKCARREFIRIIRELVVFGHRIGDYMIGGCYLDWRKLWEITESKEL